MIKDVATVASRGTACLNTNFPVLQQPNNHKREWYVTPYKTMYVPKFMHSLGGDAKVKHVHASFILWLANLTTAKHAWFIEDDLLLHNRDWNEFLDMFVF